MFVNVHKYTYSQTQFCMAHLVSVSPLSSNSSSTTSLASISPKKGLSDWAVPQASRLKYRQQFNSLDKLMSGYLSGKRYEIIHTYIQYTSTHTYSMLVHTIYLYAVLLCFYTYIIQ